MKTTIRPLVCLLVLAFAAGCGRPMKPKPTADAEKPKAVETATPTPTPKPTPTPIPWRPVTLPNAGFEDGEAGWDFSSAAGIARVDKEAANSGEFGLRLESEKDAKGAFVASPRVAVEPGTAYRLSWKGRVHRGMGTRIYARFYDADGKEMDAGGEKGDFATITDKKEWALATQDIVPPAGTASMDAYIEYPGNRGGCPFSLDLDDFVLESRPLVAESPWPGTYKLHPDEKNRLTPADVVGPDGLVYPDWTRAGIPGGIPDLSVALRLEDLGAKPGEDISGLLEKAAKEVVAKGGGVIEVGEGTFFLDQPVMIFANNVVIRGAGREKTLLLFRYRVPRGEIRFFRIQPGEEIGPNGRIEFHAHPDGLAALELRCGDKVISRNTGLEQGTYYMRAWMSDAVRDLGEGEQTFTAIAEYKDGTRAEGTINVRLVSGGRFVEPHTHRIGAVTFMGPREDHEKILLREDARRGSRTLALAPGHKLAVGNRINLVAPASDRWKQLVGHNSHWDIQAQGLYEIVSVKGDIVTLDQPVRTDFLTTDGAFEQKQTLITGCGLEGLTVEQESSVQRAASMSDDDYKRQRMNGDAPFYGVLFHKAWGGWMKDVGVRNAGTHTAYFTMSKHMEIRDCFFEDVRFNGRGGASSYAGFDTTWDSLMDHIETRFLRHAPNIQWTSSGNVIRNGRFLNSDGQWHAGFTMENLFENNFIDARSGNGPYGYGLYASGPSSGTHGPQGPRNVVYNNDIISPKDSIFMRGGNEGWMILYNRFVADRGRAIFAREKSFDHIIEGNVFIMKNAVLPPIYLGLDSTGVELVNNAFYGATPPLVGFAGGITKLARDEGNTSSPEVPDPLPARPQPAVPSIYEWQREHAAEIRAAAEAREAAAQTGR